MPSDVQREFSAGGVVVRDDQVIVIVPKRRSARGEKVLALPKGVIDPGESAQQTAVREVREEAGVDADVVEKLGDVRYWYQREGRRIFKNVAFFLLTYRSGDPDDHDWEIEEATWMPLADAARNLSYKGEREMAQRALSRLQGDR